MTIFRSLSVRSHKSGLQMRPLQPQQYGLALVRKQIFRLFTKKAHPSPSFTDGEMDGQEVPYLCEPLAKVITQR